MHNFCIFFWWIVTLQIPNCGVIVLSYAFRTILSCFLALGFIFFLFLFFFLLWETIFCKYGFALYSHYYMSQFCHLGHKWTALLLACLLLYNCILPLLFPSIALYFPFDVLEEFHGLIVLLAIFFCFKCQIIFSVYCMFLTLPMWESLWIWSLVCQFL